MPDKPQAKAIVRKEDAPVQPEVQMLREMEHSMLEMERRMDRVVRDALGQDRDLWQFPILQGLALQPGPDGHLRFQPFGHLQETLDQFLEGWREPVLSWRVGEDDRIEFRAELPGLRKADLNVEVEADRLRIAGASRNVRYKSECVPGVRIDPATAEATYEDGVLHVAARLAEPAKGKARKLALK